MRFSSNLLLFIAIGLGLITGYLDHPFLGGAAQFTSEMFLRFLKLVALPMIFLAISSTITGMKNLAEIRFLGRKVLFYTLLTTLLAAGTALMLYLVLQPASYAPHVVGGSSFVAQQPSYLSFVMNIVPTNLVEAFLQGNVIGIVLIAIVLSIATLYLPEEQKTFLHKLFSSLFGALLKVTTWIIKLMPLAIWAFVAMLFKELSQNESHLRPLLCYLGCVVGANLIQGFIILPLLLTIKGIPPWRAFRKMMPALSLAFFSKSSNATLPLTMKTMEEGGEVSPKVSSFSLPLCSIVNMNGCAAFILITTLFVSSLHGLHFGAFDYLCWILFATLAAIGNAGVPMGCFFLTSAFLLGMNVPLHMMGVILPFYAILDMIETALNVWSDCCVTFAINKDLSLVVESAEKV